MHLPSDTQLTPRNGIPVNPGTTLAEMVLAEIDTLDGYPSLSSQMLEIADWDDDIAIATVLDWAAEIRALEVGHGFDWDLALFVATVFLVG